MLAPLAEPRDDSIQPRWTGGARVALAAAVLTAAAGAALAETTLERVLGTIAATPLVSAHGVLANIAETFSAAPQSAPRRLDPGDRVIIGYDATGTPVHATADVFGVTVTPSQAAALGAGVPPGFYPAGSPLFALPASVQVSLFEYDATGAALEEARVLTETRIDGRITNRVNRVIPGDLARVASVALDQDAMIGLGMIGATALGAVNAGSIVTDVTARWDPGATRAQIDLATAQVALGASGAVQAAATTTGLASQHATQAAGGSAETAVALLNIGSNRMDITGAVLTVVRQQSLQVEAAVTTVLGAVNGGTIRPN